VLKYQLGMGLSSVLGIDNPCSGAVAEPSQTQTERHKQDYLEPKRPRVLPVLIKTLQQLLWPKGAPLLAD